MNNCVFVENFLRRDSVHFPASKDRPIRHLVGDGVHRRPLFQETLEGRLDGSDWRGVAKGCNGVYAKRMTLPGVNPLPKGGNVVSVLIGSRVVGMALPDAFLARP